MALAFTSCSYKPDTCIDFSRGIQYFQIRGALYHYQGSLVPESGEIPRFIQLFFYDPNFTSDTRLRQFPTLDPHVLSELTDILFTLNPFIVVYQTARERLAGQQ